MHIPVILAGLLLGAKHGLIVGIISPIISSLVTGMPIAFPMLPIMILELGTYGVVSGVLSKTTKLPVWLTLLITMVIGRLSYAFAYYSIKLIFLPEIQESISPIEAAITGMPGIIIQILLIPLLASVLNKRNKSK